MFSDRSKVVLKELEDALVLYQYLYMNHEHRIVVDNGITKREIRLDENLHFYAKDLTYTDLPDMAYSKHMTLNYCLGVVQHLQKQKPSQFPETFATAWEEIKQITMSNLALNFFN